MPRRPPDHEEVWRRLQAEPERAATLARSLVDVARDTPYLHWDQIRHREPPSDLTREEWWIALKLLREPRFRSVPLRDLRSRPFRYLFTDRIAEWTHEIDMGAGGAVEMGDPITTPETRDRYYVSSLIQEAITSSQLEGAATTRQEAREMLRAGRAPRHRGERMIRNNFLTMKRLRTYREDPLSPDLVFEIHRGITEGTLEEPGEAGRFRDPGDRRVVGDRLGQVFHEPPPAPQLPARLEAMCRFANAEKPFVHPVVRSIILHFWLAFDHPFTDGNGRTARALFYWSMLRHGYWLSEFVSISRIILRAPARYYRAFLYTETDENDLTYFILHQLGVFRRAMRELHDYIRRKTRETREIEARLRGMSVLNHRQRALVGHALRHPGSSYTIAGHRTSHDVVYQTARTDLLDLWARGLLHRRKVGRAYHFFPPPDLERRLLDLG